MRGLFLLVLLVAILARTLWAAQAGVLGWTWLTLMTPQKLIWGFATNWPLNLILAIVTLVAWILSREPKRISANPITTLWALFLIYITFTTFFALAPPLAWDAWDRTIKVMILGLVVSSVMNNQVRINGLVWVIVLSLGFFGVKGGLFTIVTGGHNRVLPAEEAIGDSNNLALALCMVLPLMNYLRLQLSQRFMRIGCVVAMGLTAIGILGTYSRGGLVGLAIMGGYLLWHSKNRVVLALLILLVSLPAYTFMPSDWTERMATIRSADADASFQDRIDAWETEWQLAVAHPLTGGGFNATLSPSIYHAYNKETTFPGGRAAHSIYFQVLGDHGFVGLAIYLGLLLATWHYAGATRRRAKSDPSLVWVTQLASMIQVSIVAFAVAGAALSMAYYDLFYLLIGMVLVLRRMVFASPQKLPLKPVAPSSISVFEQPVRGIAEI